MLRLAAVVVRNSTGTVTPTSILIIIVTDIFSIIHVSTIVIR
jgi:hypothetical protein